MLRYFAMAACTLLIASAAQSRPLEVADWLDWERAADAQIAPDGGTIVYSRQRVDKMADRWSSELWMMNADGSRHRYLVDGGNARWSPDGTRIAYFHSEDGRTGLFVRWMDEEGAVSQIAYDLKGPSSLAWSPDGRFIAFRAHVPMKPEWTISLPPRPEGAKWTDDATVIDTLHYRMDRVGMKEWYTHIFVVPAEGGTPRQITEGKWDVGARAVGAIDIASPIVWTPDGREILFDGLKTEDGAEPEPFVSHIYAVEVASRSMRRITSEHGFWTGPKVSPDGRRVAFAGNEKSEVTYPTPQLRLIGIDGADEQVLIDALPESASDLTWDDRGRGLYFTVGREGSQNIHHVALDGAMRDITQGVHRVSLDSIAANGVAAGTVTAPQVTRNLVRIALRDGSMEHLTDLNADILADVDLGEVEEFWTDSSDGARVQGWIVKPPAFDPNKTYKALLYIHGGPHGMYGVNFSFPFQAYAARDYVVIYSNPRGSTGYGPEFANAIDNRYPGQPDFDDLMAATDEVVGRGYVDTERLYLAGCSGGGVLTSWTVSHTDRFAAGAALCPVINWVSFAGTADIVAWAYNRFRPDFWEEPGRWLDHSPLMHANKVTTPTLLMTGELDLRTPLKQAEEFYSALKYFGVATKLIVMKGEYHGTSSKPSNMLRTIEYLDKWFTEHAPGGDAAAETAP